MIEFLRNDSPFFADLVYPLLAGSCAMTAVLAIAWYLFTPKPRNTVHLFIALVSLLIIVPALIASSATGDYRYFTILDVLNLLRIGWLGVAIGFLGFAAYYFLNFLHAWGMPFYCIGEFVDSWIAYLRQRGLCAIFKWRME